MAINFDIQFSNNASSYLIEAITSEDTLIKLASGTGVFFPTVIEGSEYFMCTLVSQQADIEIVKVIARNEDELIVERAQEGTVARNFTINDIVEHRLTAGSLMHILNEVIATPTRHGRVRLASVEEVLEGEVNDAAITPALTYLFELPLNSIIMYSGTIDIDGYPLNPDGTPNKNWASCDGRHGTTNLQNSFVIGMSSERPMHSNGGSNEPRVVDVNITRTEDHTLTIAQMPAHTHKADQAGGQSAEDGGQGRAWYKGYLDTSSVGGGQPHYHNIEPIEITLEGMPQYYSLAFIQKIA